MTIYVQLVPVIHYLFFPFTNSAYVSSGSIGPKALSPPRRPDVSAGSSPVQSSQRPPGSPDPQQTTRSALFRDPLAPGVFMSIVTATGVS